MAWLRPAFRGPNFAASADWFPPSGTMATGACYYPESWPEAQWGRDTGRRMNHGGREQADRSSALHRADVSRLVTEPAKRFGHNPQVWGWPRVAAEEVRHDRRAEQGFRRAFGAFAPGLSPQVGE